MRECLVPVGPLPDARLALEPPAVRLLDVLLARREDVEDEMPARREVALHRAQHRAAVGVGLHVQQRAERRGHERKLALDGRVAHVAVAQVELDAGERRASRARPRASRRRGRRRRPRSPRRRPAPRSVRCRRRARAPARRSASPPRGRTARPRRRSPTRGRRRGRSCRRRTRGYAFYRCRRRR